MRLGERAQRVAFGVVVVVGSVVALVLGIREVNDTPDIDVAEPRVRVENLVATVQVTVRNATDDTTFCPEIVVAALDRDGLDLDSAVAEPDLGSGRLEPGDTANFVAVLDGISAQDFEEQLDEYDAFVEAENPC